MNKESYRKVPAHAYKMTYDHTRPHDTTNQYNRLDFYLAFSMEKLMIREIIKIKIYNFFINIIEF